MNREPSSSAESDPPGPSGWPVIGSAFKSRRALTFLLENRREYGDIVYYEFLDESICQLNHPDDIKWVLVENNQAFTKSHLTKDVPGPVAGDGLFTSDGDTWREQRRRIQPAFHPDQIAVYGELMVDAVQRQLSTWDPRDRIEMNDVIVLNELLDAAHEQVGSLSRLCLSHLLDSIVHAVCITRGNRRRELGFAGAH